MRPFTALFLLVMAILPGLAVQPGERLADPAQEARARRLSLELRCLVCQNQSIDDSDAVLAADLRRLVRERIAAGDSDRQIRDFLVARYGEFVLLNPPFSERTLLLWSLPALALLAGAGAVWTLFRRRRAATLAAAPLSAEEEAALRRLLDTPRQD
ncbi:MAG: cytochrome c-type biogenesis protein CcmH [Hyphomicrobiales bacterium]|uniref:cytochrome c-type biogenesis protein n=1 Tax=Rhabdaerophilum calidifontis TaxID=2604328 RepID=UPI00123B11B9|nr:cytochrome c-type biogenesis protein [Rhabdaerophilum calidifontis]MCA1953226.1 cytochrome c-type biogenesis protein CcmH [Hyphomicrobiales bacterium]MCA1999325.1 cytochrome c-type biogenesis protein CcmH [Hyphomicrobiales bacterium]